MNAQNKSRAVVAAALAASSRWLDMTILALAASLLTIALAAFAGYAVADTSWRTSTRADQLTVEQRASVYEYASNRLCRISASECVRLAHFIQRQRAAKEGG